MQELNRGGFQASCKDTQISYEYYSKQISLGKNTFPTLQTFSDMPVESLRHSLVVEAGRGKRGTIQRCPVHPLVDVISNESCKEGSIPLESLACDSSAFILFPFWIILTLRELHVSRSTTCLNVNWACQCWHCS